jgi:hypothetical protein
VQFYWLRSGEQAVEVQATVGGQPKTGKTIFNVEKPIAKLDAVQGDVFVGKYKLSDPEEHTRLALAKSLLGKRLFMRFGEASHHDPDQGHLYDGSTAL